MINIAVVKTIFFHISISDLRMSEKDQVCSVSFGYLSHFQIKMFIEVSSPLDLTHKWRQHHNKSPSLQSIIHCVQSMVCQKHHNVALSRSGENSLCSFCSSKWIIALCLSVSQQNSEHFLKAIHDWLGSLFEWIYLWYFFTYGVWINILN